MKNIIFLVLFLIVNPLTCKPLNMEFCAIDDDECSLDQREPLLTSNYGINPSPDICEVDYKQVLS